MQFYSDRVKKGCFMSKENWKEVKAQLVKNIVQDNFSDKENTLPLGTYYTAMIHSDIKHLAFTFSRYKFVSKMLMYKKNVKLLELGCQEALGGVLLKQNISLEKYVGIDLDEDAIQWNKRYMPKEFEFICNDFFAWKDTRKYDAIVSLDVIEHIPLEMEDRYCQIICENLQEDGVAIIGTPNITMSPYASEASKLGHVNLYDQDRLYHLMNKYFHNVFMFNMNDEVVNTGFSPMSCYIFAVCCNKK